MADKKKNQTILWEVGCDGHVDAWVVAPNWEKATVKAAEFWGVSWASVAAWCDLKKRVEGAPTNVCCKCGRVYYGEPPMCVVCKKEIKLEEEDLRRRLSKAYREGKVI